ncbi:MAG: tyrosine-type recombinase/integrase [Methylotenera sp.]|nr:tyrosine-type recombinase/integrase [Methylotenera sp.]
MKESENKASVETIAIHIVAVVPFIGHLEVEKIHDGTLESFKASRIADRVTPTTINRALEVVRTILIRAAKVYRDEDGLPWLKQAPPAITMLDETPREPCPLSWSQQEALFKHLPKHLANMALFAINSGLRDSNVCGLLWEWEVKVPEVGRSVFVIPWQFHKTGKRKKRSLVVILNDAAWSILNEQRGLDAIHVFVYRQERRKHHDLAPLMQYHRIGTMNNSAWHTAREKAGLPKLRIHDLRHTYGARLRAAGVLNEDRASLLGHATKSMPEHYAAADIGRLINLSNGSLDRKSTCTVLSVINR